MIVEVCANSLQSALNAEKAGADRIELCAELGVGGVTPSMGLIKSVLDNLSIPVHVLIRPRSAHFTYTPEELKVMLADITLCRAIGVHGVVSGALLANGALDLAMTQKLMERAGPMHFTFHRAFDWVPDAMTALQDLCALGVQTILTSGQRAKAEEGLPLLQQLQAAAKSCTIMAGGGIHAGNAKAFKEAGLSALHLSATQLGHLQPMEGRLPLNATKHINEDSVAVTNAQVVRNVALSVK